MKKHIFFWVLIGGILSALYFIMGGILMPFILAFILAYFLNPLVNRLEKLKINRTFASLIVLVLFFLLLILFFMICIPFIETQLMLFLSKMPNLISKTWIKIEPVFLKIKERLFLESSFDLSETLKEYSNSLLAWSKAFLLTLVEKGFALVNLLSLLVIAPIACFYMLLDWQPITTFFKKTIPVKYQDSYEKFIKEIDGVLIGFVQGQTLVCLFLSLFYGFGFMAVGLEHGFIMGFLTGWFSFIPYVGSISAFILSMLMAFVQEGSLLLFIGIIVVVMIGQFLEGNILTPKLVGDKVGIPPVWVLFALLAGGSLFGFVGMLIATPAAGVLAVFTKHFYRWYLQSSYYLGKSSAPVKTSERKK